MERVYTGGEEFLVFEVEWHLGNVTNRKRIKNNTFYNKICYQSACSKDTTTLTLITLPNE